MADLTFADFFSDYFELRGDLHDLVTFRRTEKDAFMRDWLNHRWAVSLPGAVNTEHEEEVPASMFRYALHHEHYDFFESPRARKALAIEKVDHLTGTCMRPGGVLDYPLVLGILAHYYQDGAYRAVRDGLPYPQAAKGSFQGRYVEGIRRYSPGPELAPQVPGVLAGVTVPEMDGHRKGDLGVLEQGHFKVTALDPDEVLDFATFRGGFEKNDDLLLLNGLASHALPGAIVNFSSHGQRWLGQVELDGGGAAYFNNNAVHVLRTDRWMDQSALYSAAAQRDWLADWEKGGAVSMTLEPFVGMRWQRQVIWLEAGLFVIRDTLTALEAGAISGECELVSFGRRAVGRCHADLCVGENTFSYDTVGRGLDGGVSRR